MPSKKGFMKNNDTEVLSRIQSQLEALNEKLDLLLKKSTYKPAERSSDFERGSERSSGRDADRNSEYKTGKMLYKAVCSSCKKTCGVPFKPAGGRPVLCSECFANQQDGGEREPRFQKTPRDFRKPASGKKSFFKKR